MPGGGAGRDLRRVVELPRLRRPGDVQRDPDRDPGHDHQGREADQDLPEHGGELSRRPPPGGRGAAGGPRGCRRPRADRRPPRPARARPGRAPRAPGRRPRRAGAATAGHIARSSSTGWPGRPAVRRPEHRRAAGPARRDDARGSRRAAPRAGRPAARGRRAASAGIAARPAASDVACPSAWRSFTTARAPGGSARAAATSSAAWPSDHDQLAEPARRGGVDGVLEHRAPADGQQLLGPCPSACPRPRRGPGRRRSRREDTLAADERPPDGRGRLGPVGRRRGPRPARAPARASGRTTSRPSATARA